MEGAQKTSINLEAGLDISTSDMLTPLASHTFQHNWQRYQGKFLPNSLRFEKNGWAAGWNVYNFDYNTFRSEQNGYYVGIGQLNSYVKTLNVYESEGSYNPLYTVYVVTDTKMTVGDLTVNGNSVSGLINGKNFTLTWDPAAKKLTCSDPTIGFTQTINSDYSVSFVLNDLSSSFSYDFNILISGQLTGDAFEKIVYTGYADGKHSWGQYTYDTKTGNVTTPEGITVKPSVSGNEIAFDYTHTVMDESIAFLYTLTKFYPRFTDIKCSDLTNKENMIIDSSVSEKHDFNKYKASVSPDILKAEDENGVIIDWQLPLWITASLSVELENPEARKCDNVKCYEVAVMKGSGLNMKGKYSNVWEGEGEFKIDDDYRPLYTKYLKDLKYRFNQIFLDNTIGLSPNWDYRKHLLNSTVWYLTSRQYSNLRNKRSADMTRLLGDVYEWGSFCIEVADKVEYNYPYDMSDKDCCIYKKQDISNILTFKKKGDDDNTDEGEDLDFVENLMSADMDATIIAKFVGIATDDGVAAVDEYTSDQSELELSDLYDNGVYVGTTYESVGTVEEPFWPFEKVPKFNFKDSGGNVHVGVYWTDGTKIITDLDEFKEKVLGVYDDSIDPMDSIIKDNPNYCRTRVVNCYAAAYDFDFLKKSTYQKLEDYNNDVDAWNAVWDKYYPNTISPQYAFSEDAESEDDTYLDFSDITIERSVDPNLKFVAPGVYLTENSGAWQYYAVMFGCPSGVIIYDGDNEYKMSSDIWHHSLNVNTQYTLDCKHEEGTMYLTLTEHYAIPYYFGTYSSEKITKGVKNNSIKQSNITVKLSSAKLTLGVNYAYQKQSSGIWPFRRTWYEWTPKGGKSTNWLNYLLISYSANKVEVRNAALRSGVEQIRSYYCMGDMMQGVKFAWPVWGHSQTRLTYPEMKDLTTINNPDSLVLEIVPTDKLKNKDIIYFDRDDTDKSQKLFEVVENSRMPDNGDGTGNMSLSLNPLGNGSMYYAEKILDDNQNEIIAKYYIPGIAFGSVDDDSGNLSVTTQTPTLKLEWKVVAIKFPTSLIQTFSNNNSSYSEHIFYTSDKSLLTNLSYELGEIDFENCKQDITINFPAGKYVLHYDGTLEVTTGDAMKTVMSNGTESVVAVACAGLSENVVMPLTINLFYKNNKAKFVSLSKYTLVSSDGDRCVITDGKSQITYSINQQSVIFPDSGVDVSISTITGGQHVIAEGNTQNSFAGYFKGVYDGTINGDIVSFEYRGMQFNWDLSMEIDSGITVLSTDVRKPEKTNIIGKIKPEGQYQLLRQQWNTTVEVENYWWVDATHVLELNQYSFILKRNTGELDDWNGERFEKVFEVGRDVILPTNIIRYFATNVYKSDRPALFVTLQEDLGSILLKFYNPRRAFEIVGTQRITLRQRDIGQQLNDISMQNGEALFNTYNPLTAVQLLSKAEWSHTIVGNYLIIGCHLCNNYDQWAIVINLVNMALSKCVQGYGYVGLHGDLTGGQIPNDYFDVNKGFNDTVQPLSVLKSSDQDLNNLDAAYEVGSVEKINQVESRVVGTSEQQWYIRKKLYGIVSHLTFNEGNFTKQLLPITNNFSAIYSSPSFASSVFADLFVQVSPFESMFKFDGAAAAVWKTFMIALTYPSIYSVAPRYAQLAYLQQTFGQYAYVHYNSSKSLPEKEITNSQTDSGMSEPKNKQTDPVLSDSFTFDKQKFSQNTDTGLSYFDNIMAILLASFADSLQFLDKKVAMNEEVNTSSVKDAGRKFVGNAVANTGDMLAAAVMTQSKNDSGLSSAVTGLKSIDMFYSTSDQQRVFAGPGFVEHQMVANCIAQSATDTQVEGKVQQFYFCIRSLTTLQMKLAMKLLLLAADALDKAAESVAAQVVCGTSLGAAAAAMNAAAAAIRVGVAVLENALAEIEKILDAICAKGMTVNIDGQVSRHALSIEGKHKYGEKNEVFMWPCFGIQPGQIKYTDEWVECGIRNTPWMLTLNSVKYYSNGLFNACNVIMSWSKPTYSLNKMGSKGDAVSNCGDTKSWNGSKGRDDFDKPGDTYRAYYMYGNVPFHQASAVGKAEERLLPDDMACVEGVCRFLPNEPFKNENIAVSDPAFAPSMQQDYVIDKTWDLSQYCTYGMQQWVAVKDTKVIDCPPSNMVVSDNFCGIACPYTAVEVKRGIEKAYMRPWAITPNTLAMNCTGYNTILQDKLYHAFDGISFRLVNLVGSPGMNKNLQTFFYSFQVNDRFKRSNIVPANELQGNFESEPVQAVDSIDKLFTLMTIAAKEKGLESGTIGEDKDLIRWSVPVFTEHVSTLPAAVKTMTAAPLGVVDGVTALCVDLVNNQSAYKAPLSVDFTIGKNVYRATEEYICSVQTQNGIDIVTDLIPSLGLKYIGSTPTEAYFYSKSTRCYYTFTGSSLTKMDMMERFRDIQKGYWDFVNQEVVMPCLMTFKRLNAEVEDKDTETDNIIIPVLSKNQVSGELPPPITTIFNDRSWYKCVSLPCGFAYQGPNRVIINRAIFCEYMERSVKSNYGKWKKMNREKYVTHREYPEKYSDIMSDVRGVDGWTYNPFVLVTSALGQSEDTDCLFEWNITFCWPIEMDLLYSADNFAVVNIAAETMTPGGKVVTRPTHVFLTKELFTRTGNYGYYSFRYQSKNGMGNRERLHIWSDQYIAISSIDCDCKVETSRRNEQLTQQIDVAKLKEL